jgi:hypothetical protein
MDNKIILELVAKNLEEIKLLVETLRDEEKADHLLIELTATKAKTLYQELMLLLPNSSEKIEYDQVVVVNNDSTEEDVSVEETHSEIVIEDDAVEEFEIGENTPPMPFVENELQTISEIEASSTEVHENSESETDINIPEPVNELVENVQPEPEPIQPIEIITEEKIPEVVLQEAVLPEMEIPEVEMPEEILSEEKIPEEILTEEKLDEPRAEIQEKKIIGEQFTNEPSLNEKLAASNTHESKIKGKPVTNIMNAIGLNDRFLFTRELFANDSKIFETTVDQIDRLKSFLEAIYFLEANFKWTKSEASLKFMELLKRRFES